MFFLLHVESICEEQKGMVRMMIKNGILDMLTYVFLHETDPEVLVCLPFLVPLLIIFELNYLDENSISEVYLEW